MITIKKLIEVQEEAERFIASVEKCLIRLEKEKESGWTTDGNKETGAVQRASLDLTRSLADFRRRERIF